MSASALDPDSTADTPRLNWRPARAPQFEAESEALIGLLRSIRETNPKVLQELATAALHLCRAHSAGISVEENVDGRKMLRWHAAVGRWLPFLNHTVPRDATACGLALDRGVPLLLAHPERHLRYMETGVPAIVEILVVPFALAGETPGTLWVAAHDDSREFDREDLRVLRNLSECAPIALEALQRARSALGVESRGRPGADRPRPLSTGLLHESEVEVLCRQILDAAIMIMQADFGTLHTIGEDGDLRLLGWRGLHPDTARSWQRISPESGTPFVIALRTGERFLIADAEAGSTPEGAAHLAECRCSGIRAVQSAPLKLRSGQPVGVISTHWRSPHVPSVPELRLFDVLTRIAADLIERVTIDRALKEADSRKSEFLATLSHELRNPLSPLTTGLELLRRQDNRTPLVEGIHSMMGRQLSHLRRLVDDLLDVSRIARGVVDVHRAPLELGVVIEAAVELARPIIEQRRHTLVLENADRALPVDGDFERLTQVITNVLRNAAKYTEPGGTIDLRVRSEDGVAFIHVRDTGFGIPAEQLENVFNMFAQIPEHCERSGGGGLGIGLALCRQLLQLHGGSIQARSEGRGRGSEFVIRLPLAAASVSELPGSGLEVPMAIKAQRVLIIDDNADAVRMLQLALEAMGHAVEVAHDGPTGLTLFASFRPDVLLLDIGLPGMDGYAIARRIRSMPGAAPVVIAAVTGWGQDRDRERSREAGCDHHLTKPVTLKALEPVLSARPAGANPARSSRFP